MRRAISRRSHRLNDQIMRALALILLEEVQDPRLELVTVSGVRLNSDITIAEVYLTFSGGQERQAEVLKALGKAKGFLRSRMGRELHLKKIPDLRFRFDSFLEDMVYDNSGE